MVGSVIGEILYTNLVGLDAEHDPNTEILHWLETIHKAKSLLKTPAPRLKPYTTLPSADIHYSLKPTATATAANGHIHKNPGSYDELVVLCYTHPSPDNFLRLIRVFIHKFKGETFEFSELKVSILKERARRLVQTHVSNL